MATRVHFRTSILNNTHLIDDIFQGSIRSEWLNHDQLLVCSAVVHFLDGMDARMLGVARGNRNVDKVTFYRRNSIAIYTITEKSLELFYICIHLHFSRMHVHVLLKVYKIRI